MSLSEIKRNSAGTASIRLRTHQDFIDEFPNAHLVVATVRTKAALEPSRQLLAQLLLKALKPQGYYAVGEWQNGRDFAAHCVFEREADAVKLGMAAWATRVDGNSGFASQRVFLFNREAQETIKLTLAELGKG